MGKKKKDLKINEKNQLISELKDTDLVKNPFCYSQIRGDFTLMQTNIMIAVITELQKEINEYLEQAKNNAQAGQLAGFDELDFENTERVFRIPMKNLDIQQDDYDELEEACRKLTDIKAVYPRYDRRTGLQSLMIANVFSYIEIPRTYESKDAKRYKFKSGSRREGYILVTMSGKIMLDVFDMQKGYVEHVRRIVPMCKRKRTPRLYIYLSRWKDFGHKLVDFLELKEYLGVLTWNAKRTEVKEDAYPKFSEFCRYVLDPVRAEMDALAAENRIEFSFTYEPRYPAGKRRGNPESLFFHITLSGLGRERKGRMSAGKDQADYMHILREEYGLTESDLAHLFRDVIPEMFPAINAEILAIKERVDKYKPRSVRAYVLQSLRNFIESIRPTVEELPAAAQEETASPAPAVNRDDLECFRLFLDLARGAVGQQAYDTWLACLSLHAFDGTTVTVKVPAAYVAERIHADLLPRLHDSIAAAFGEGARLAYTL